MRNRQPHKQQKTRQLRRPWHAALPKAATPSRPGLFSFNFGVHYTHWPSDWVKIGSSYIQNNSPSSSFAPLTMVPWAPPHHSSAPAHGSLHPPLLSPTLVFRWATSTNHSQSLSKLSSKATAARQPTGALLQTKPQHHGGIQRPLLLVDFQGHQKSCHHIVMGCQKCDLVTRIGKVVHHFLTEAKAICPAYRVALDTNVRFGLH